MDEFISFEDLLSPDFPSKYRSFLDKMFNDWKSNISRMKNETLILNNSIGNQVTPQNIRKQADVGAAIDAIKEKTKQYNAVAAETERQMKELATMSAKYNSATSETTRRIEEWRSATKRANDETRLAGKLADAPVGSLQRLRLEMQQNIALRNRMSVIDKQTQKDYDLITQKINQQNSALKAADAQIGNHQRNVGNYSTALKNVGAQLMGLAAAYISLQGALNIAKNIFSTTKELNSLSFSFKVLIADTKELADTQSYLGGISQRFGLNILTTSQAYLKFRASIAATNFSLQKSQQVFTSVAKAGAVLGLSSDRMQLVFLALEQMISKGTISTEELRRQLGDNLPGAMNIMADALGVTIPQLLKMIKANKVLAEDALPKFAVALEKAYGIDSLNQVDNMQASLGRLQTAWVGLVDKINASKFSQGIIDALAKIVRSVYANPEERESAIVSEEMTKINKNLSEIETKVKSGKSPLIEYGDALTKAWQKALSESGKFKIRLKEVTDQIMKASGPEQDVLTDRAIELQAQYNAWIKIAKELDKMAFGKWQDIFKPSDAVVDEELQKLRDELDAAEGILEVLEAQKKINEYFIQKSKDPSGDEQKKLAYQNELIEQQIKDLTELIDAKKLSDQYSKEAADFAEQDLKDQEQANKKLRKASQDRTDAFLDGEDEIRRKREAFYQKVRRMDGEQYKWELEELKRLLEEKKITEEQYFFVSMRMWMERNRATIEATKDLSAAAFNVANEIYNYKADQVKREIDLYTQEIDALKTKLDQEKDLKDEGKANDYDRLASELSGQEKLRSEAQKRYEKYQKRQAQLKFLETQANLGVSVAEAFAASAGQGPAGWIAAIAAAASLIASFISMQNQIKNIGAGQQYGEGGWIEGKSHKEGGVNINAEGDEFMVKKSVARKYGTFLEALNDDKIPNIYSLNFGRLPGNVQVYNNYDELLREARRSRKVNEELLQVAKTSPASFYTPQGDTIVMRGNSVKRIKGS